MTATNLTVQFFKTFFQKFCVEKLLFDAYAFYIDSNFANFKAGHALYAVAYTTDNAVGDNLNIYAIFNYNVKFNADFVIFSSDADSFCDGIPA